MNAPAAVCYGHRFTCAESYSNTRKSVTGQSTRQSGAPQRMTARRLAECIMWRMSTALSAADPATGRPQRRREIVAALAEVLPRAAILFRHEDTAPFECDAL